MTLLSNEGYDIVIEDYELINLAVPNMTVVGADRDLADVGNSVDIVENQDPNSVQVSGEIELHSPFIYSVSSGNVGTSAAPNLFTPTAPDVSAVSGTLANGTYVVNLTNGSMTDSSAAGMTAQVTVASNAISAVQILNYGTNYSIGDTMTVVSTSFGELVETSHLQLMMQPEPLVEQE